MARAATLHRLRIRRSQNLRRQHHITLSSLQWRFQTRSRLIRVMTLDARQHTLPIGAVFLQRVVLVIERNFAVLIRLAVLRQYDFLGLDLAGFFLDNNGETAKQEKENQEGFHRLRILSHGHAEGGTRMTPLAVTKPKVAAECSSAIVTGRTGPSRSRVPKVLRSGDRTHLPRLRSAGSNFVAIGAFESLTRAVVRVTERATVSARVGTGWTIRFLIVTNAARCDLATGV